MSGGNCCKIKLSLDCWTDFALSWWSGPLSNLKQKLLACLSSQVFYIFKAVQGICNKGFTVKFWKRSNLGWSIAAVYREVASVNWTGNDLNTTLKFCKSIKSKFIKHSTSKRVLEKIFLYSQSVCVYLVCPHSVKSVGRSVGRSVDPTHLFFRTEENFSMHCFSQVSQTCKYFVCFSTMFEACMQAGNRKKLPRFSLLKLICNAFYRS